MKIVTAKGDVYQIYSIDLSDMEKASLAYDEESSTAYLTYTSLADKSEKDTKGNSQQTASSDESDDSDTETYSSDDSSDDSSYDSGSSDSSSSVSYTHLDVYKRQIHDRISRSND